MQSPNKRYCISSSQRLSTVQVKEKIEDEGLFDEDDVKFLHRDCPVCIGEYTTEVSIDKINICKPCNHPFCRDCLCTWAKTHNTCPTCKGEIQSILIEKNIEKSFDEYCFENNIINDSYSMFDDNTYDLSQLAFNYPSPNQFGRNTVFNDDIIEE